MILRPRCIYIELEIHDAARLFTFEVEKSQNHHPVGLRSNWKLHQHPLHQKIGPTYTTTHPRKKTLQCWWNPEQSRNLKIFHWHNHKDGNKKNLPKVLPHWPRRQPSHPGVPMVRKHTTIYQLGKRLDRLLATTHCTANWWCRQSNICHQSMR